MQSYITDRINRENKETVHFLIAQFSSGLIVLEITVTSVSMVALIIIATTRKNPTIIELDRSKRLNYDYFSFYKYHYQHPLVKLPYIC
jgi:hypothetical protein